MTELKDDEFRIQDDDDAPGKGPKVSVIGVDGKGSLESAIRSVLEEVFGKTDDKSDVPDEPTRVWDREHKDHHNISRQLMTFGAAVEDFRILQRAAKNMSRLDWSLGDEAMLERIHAINRDLAEVLRRYESAIEDLEDAFQATIAYEKDPRFRELIDDLDARGSE